MKDQILVTDSFFIFDKHVERLEGEGFEVVRLDKPRASEAELSEAIKGKTGYILGGVEHATKPVFNAADKLKAIVFTGTGFKGHIPAWEYAIEKGVHVGYSPYANVQEVAEWAVAAALAMQRNLFGLGPCGSQSFTTVSSLSELSVGIIGLGHIGLRFAEMIDSLGAKEVSYWSRKQKDTTYRYYEDMDDLLKSSDMVFVSVADEAGKDFISERELNLLKKDCLLVSIVHEGVINEDSLYAAVRSGKIRAALDVVSEFNRFKELPADRWYAPNGSSAFNTWSFLNRASDMATETIINLIKTGEDKYKVTR